MGMSKVERWASRGSELNRQDCELKNDINKHAVLKAKEGGNRAQYDPAGRKFYIFDKSDKQQVTLLQSEFEELIGWAQTLLTPEP